MAIVRRALLLSIVVTVVVSLFAASSTGATFRFGSLRGAALNGLSVGSETAEDVTMQLAAGPNGALLSELNTDEMGISSVSIVGAIDSDEQSFNVLESPGVLAGIGESLRFSFDQPGILTGLNFDGVKDESLEYFILETAGVRINFFDSAANGPIGRHDPEQLVSGSVDEAVAGQLVTGQVILLQESAGIDDEVRNLALPFSAGQEFILSYGELDAALETTEAGNGAQLQSITVVAVPEPASQLSALVVLIAAWCCRRWR